MPVGGYVTDVPYVRGFVRQLAPAWLDHVARVSGFAPPNRPDSFTWCDLGCGQGVTAAILAATHPNGSFHGIDAMPVHVDFARRLASEAELPNAHFHAIDFDTAVGLDFPAFDYIVAHGVYSWVDGRTRASCLRFIERNLKPGGLAYISYNAMPGRAADLPYQRLIRALGESLPGNSQARVAAAIGVVRSMVGLKAHSLLASPLAAAVQENGDRLEVAYLAHELMNADWEPLCVTQVRSAAAGIGLRPVGSATLIQNHDSFVLRKAAREVLAGIADEDVRELARDYFINQSFRRDVFVREGQPLNTSQRRAGLMQDVFFRPQPHAQIEYCLATLAGKLSFDNPAARHIVGGLTAGPRRLADLSAPGIADKDLIANLLVLSAAGAVWPGERDRDHSPSDSLERLNAAILRRVGGEEEIRWLGVACGTAISTRTREIEERGER